ncbi:pentatricopeptide repeat-containing protein At2g13600-like [Magnolia sinica]|uniref:pentatricopeptide repeat-containing protein At2g13600-like n=1 Tax=Magnolia sinica TaxID=86752 RepID=UPI002658938C|nr:pentatricopeptide repeat-containing protein At2g13600-like [Magnolia sinica]
MHAKCGDPDRAYELFQSWKDKDVVCYSSMIEGFGVHGRGKEALQIFRQLQEEGLKPDSICFIGILSTCSHAGLVDEGGHYFESMRNEYLIPPTADHYMCMVDQLGHAGYIEEAYRIITTMMPPVQPHAGVWGPLLNACRIHSDIKLGEKAAWHLLELEPENAGNYLLLSNMYAKTRKWEDVAKVRALMRKCGMRKPPGCSWIEVEGNIHRLLVADVWDI